MMSTQAEQLAGEKSDAENHIKQLEREKIDLQKLVAQRGINANSGKDEEASTNTKAERTTCRG